MNFVVPSPRETDPYNNVNYNPMFNLKHKHFLVLQLLLSNPVLENAVNPNAAQIFASSPTSFRQMVLDCVLASKRVEGKIIAHQF